MSEEISREEIAALLARESMSEEMTREQARDTLRNAAWLGTDEERELIEKAVEVLCGEQFWDEIKAIEAELATKTCNKQIASKLEDAELARDSEETCNNKQVISKLDASEDAISRQAAIDAVNTGNLHPGIVGALQSILADLPPVTPQPCEYCISRQAVLALPRYKVRDFRGKVVCETINVTDIVALSPVTPQYTRSRNSKDTGNGTGRNPKGL